MELSGNKTMAQASKEVGRTVTPATDIHSNKLESMLGADSYSEFPASTTMSFETYPKRIETLSAALGNKDSVKG